MPTFEFTSPDGKTYSVEGPEGATQEQAFQILQGQSGQKNNQPQATWNPSAASAANVYNSATFGFGDELAGIGGGIVGGLAGALGVEGESFSKGYTETRDKVRNEIEAFARENPKTAMLGSVSGGLLTGTNPTAAISRGVRIMNPVGNAAATSGILGAGYGAGSARELSDVPVDATVGGLTGAATAGVLTGATNVVGAVGSNIRQRFSPTYANKIAEQKIAEAMVRDGISPDKLGVNLQRFGPSGVTADAGGQNVRSLLDSAANAPGATKELAARVIRDRQIGRADRLTDAASKGMAGGNRLATTLDDLQVQQKAAAPLYQKAMQQPLTIDDDLSRILGRIESTGAFKDAQKIAQISGQPFTLARKAGEPVTLNQLNEAKKMLWDIEQAAKDSITGKATTLSSTITGLRREFIKKLDDMTTDASGQSVYRQARETFAEPASLSAAAELGKKSFGQKAFNLNETMKDLSGPEKQAFRVGAFEAYRELAGSPSGQSQIINLFKDRTFKERMQQLFPSDSGFRRLAVEAGKEGKRRQLESIRGGSQTFERMQAADDLSGVSQVAGAARDAVSGNVAGVLKSAADLYRRGGTPEPVRNRIGEILLNNGTKGRFTNAMGQQVNPRNDQINRLADLMREQQNRQPGLLGATFNPRY